MTEPKLTIEEFTSADADEVLAINAANQPEVGPMDEEKLRLLAAESDAFPVVRLDGEAVGFAVLLTEGTAYQSPNYRWFERRNPRFYYVDRIAFTLAARGRGLGENSIVARWRAPRSSTAPCSAPRSTPSPPTPSPWASTSASDSARSRGSGRTDPTRRSRCSRRPSTPAPDGGVGLQPRSVRHPLVQRFGRFVGEVPTALLLSSIGRNPCERTGIPDSPAEARAWRVATARDQAVMISTPSGPRNRVCSVWATSTPGCSTRGG